MPTWKIVTLIASIIIMVVCDALIWRRALGTKDRTQFFAASVFLCIAIYDVYFTITHIT